MRISKKVKRLKSAKTESHRMVENKLLEINEKK
jgi:hypothetical protein